ncbi:unnamed protein product [Camellia sinensis]
MRGGGYNNGDGMLPDEDIMIFPQRALSRESIRRFKSHSNPPQVTLSGSDSNGNREFWIKTDAGLVGVGALEGRRCILNDRTKYYLLASFVLHIKHSESDCSDVPIIQALQRDVRVFELDIWPNSTKDNVNVLHGR